MSPESWAEDFSYAYYERLLHAAAERFTVAPATEVARLHGSGARLLLLRHDIDLSPSRALPMARLESTLGFRATYFVMVRSPFYSVERNVEAIRQLEAAGHEIGLHFTPDGSPGDAARAGLERTITEQAGALAGATGCAVRSVSFHRPLANHLHGPDEIAGLLNANAARCMQWYLSDSRGHWREGDPMRSLLEDRGPVLQMLTHPIWWGDRHRPAPEVLEDFYREATRGMPEAAAAEFDEALAASISTPRLGRVMGS